MVQLVNAIPIPINSTDVDDDADDDDDEFKYTVNASWALFIASCNEVNQSKGFCRAVSFGKWFGMDDISSLSSISKDGKDESITP